MATSSLLGFYVLVHYGSQYFYGLKEKENVSNKSSVRLDFCCCALARCRATCDERGLVEKERPLLFFLPDPARSVSVSAKHLALFMKVNTG